MANTLVRVYSFKEAIEFAKILQMMLRVEPFIP